jgi:hypothetical protein
VETHALHQRLILGIGHKVKSLENRLARGDRQELRQKHFKSTEVLDFALAVELKAEEEQPHPLPTWTAIATTFNEYQHGRAGPSRGRRRTSANVQMGAPNGLFIMGRSIPASWTPLPGPEPLNPECTDTGRHLYLVSGSLKI